MAINVPTVARPFYRGRRLASPMDEEVLNALGGSGRISEAATLDGVRQAIPHHWREDIGAWAVKTEQEFSVATNATVYDVLEGGTFKQVSTVRDDHIVFGRITDTNNAVTSASDERERGRHRQRFLIAFDEFTGAPVANDDKRFAALPIRATMVAWHLFLDAAPTDFTIAIEKLVVSTWTEQTSAGVNRPDLNAAASGGDILITSPPNMDRGYIRAIVVDDDGGGITSARLVLEFVH